MVDQGSSKKQKRSASSTSASRATKRPASPFEEDDEPDLQEEEEEEDDNGEDDEHEPRAESSTASARRAAKKPKKSNSRTAGIVYISRVPPGMTPQKIRHLMDRWGEVGKVYAQRRDGEFTRSFPLDAELILQRRRDTIPIRPTKRSKSIKRLISPKHGSSFWTSLWPRWWRE